MRLLGPLGWVGCCGACLGGGAPLAAAASLMSCWRVAGLCVCDLNWSALVALWVREDVVVVVIVGFTF